MKKLILYIASFVLMLFIAACQRPQPTELVADEDVSESNLDIKTIPLESEFIYTNGYDSTAVSSPVPRFSNVISVSSIKKTYRDKTYKAGLATAVFFDKAQPVRGPGGRMLGYRTRVLGLVSFENVSARMMPFVGTFREMGMPKDTVLGYYYILYKSENSGDAFVFRPDSKINFKLKAMNRTEQIDIVTPVEVSGEVNVTGSRQNKTLSFILKWNGIKEGKIEIVAGGIKHGSSNVKPFFSIQAPDNGKVKIPPNLIKNIPLEEFSRLVFTLVRRKVTQNESNSILKDNSIVAQSIHSIQLDVPN